MGGLYGSIQGVALPVLVGEGWERGGRGVGEGWGHPGPQGTNENTPGAVGACVLDRLRLASRSIYSVAACDLKPIFHCDAKKLRWALALA